ncbi:MAG: enoyl-CoA hydratase/isomerase family protein [Robiginitomaculum sp.]|nr:enoyl-CoA hydratase/isomerase family protein [Robiginitomaculum sp.]
MTNQIQFEVFGNLGVVTLNRPKALNALTTEMCAAMTKVMLAWEDDDRIGAVLVEGAGERAFCAGGDIIMLHDSAKAGDGRAEEFWRTEYALNELIYRYKKPYIAMIDGIVMGGGVGLSVHGRLRVAGDNTLFAMPETGIGYFPDVGGTYFLPRLGKDIGNWLGLTGARLKTAQTCAFGIANVYIPSDKHEAFKTALGKAELNGLDGPVMEVLKSFVKRPDMPAPLPQAIDAFDKDTLPEIYASLRSYANAKPNKSNAENIAWASKQLSFLESKSPLAVYITFEALRRGGKFKFREAMRQELDLSLNFTSIPDFVEGVRAAVIDKDRNPKWAAASIADVNLDDVRAAFRQTQKELEFLD